jgi:hypothetical protein
MAGRAGQLGFEFKNEMVPSPASVELAASRARASSMPRVRHDGATLEQSAGAQAASTNSPQTRAASASAERAGGTPPFGGEAAAGVRFQHDNATAVPAGAFSQRQHDGAPAAPAESDAFDDLLCALADEAEIAAPVRSESDEALAQALELALRVRHGSSNPSLRLSVTDNVRTMVSLRRDKLREQIEARVHHMFLHAPPEIWTALGEYLFSGERESASSIARYIEQHRQSIRRPPLRPIALSTRGRHHDLLALCSAINERYFAGRVSVNVTWARSQTGRPNSGRRSIKLGSYTSRDRLIRVHPALDAAFVPRYFVEYIIYHEMLHHVLPPKLQNGRRELHGPAFVARERQFEDYQAALQWERENLGKLLRRRARRKSSVER